MEKNNALKLIVLFVLAIGLLAVFFSLNFLTNKTGTDNQVQKNDSSTFNIKEYAEQKGFKNYFKYEGNWYINVNGQWIGVKEYAEQQEYKDYFTSKGNWYLNDNGQWKTVKEYADEKGYKDSFLFRGINYEYKDGQWIRITSK